MTETTEMTDTSLRLERTYEASAEDVFDAWTNPEVLRRWWKNDPNGNTPIAEVDLRVGGRYRLSMEDSAGTRHTVGGEYHEVKRPMRLVYSWRWELDSGEPGHESTVTVEFHADGEQTNLVLEHTGLASAESRDQHTHGWSVCLDTLQSSVFG